MCQLKVDADGCCRCFPQVQSAASGIACTSLTYRAQLTQFNLKHTCDFGESFAVVGSGPQLGDWDPSCAIPLEWQEDGSWAGQILLNAGERVEYKYLLQGKGSQPSWQPGENLVLALDSITPNGDVVVRVEDPWVGESTWQVEGGEVFTINVDEEKPSSSKPAEEVLDAGHEQRRAPRSAKGFTGGSDAEAEAGSPKVLQAQLPARNISGSDAAEVSWPVASTAAMSSEAQWEESRQSQHMQKVDAKQASPTSLASMAKISGWWKDLLGIWPQTPPQQSGHDRHG
eukprot:jgi/Chlat1/3008/Chrsp201S00795